MHYLILATLKIPLQVDQKIQKQIAELENKKQNWDSPLLADALIEKYNSMRDDFSERSFPRRRTFWSATLCKPKTLISD